MTTFKLTIAALAIAAAASTSAFAAGNSNDDRQALSTAPATTDVYQTRSVAPAYGIDSSVAANAAAAFNAHQDADTNAR